MNETWNRTNDINKRKGLEASVSNVGLCMLVVGDATGTAKMSRLEIREQLARKEKCNMTHYDYETMTGEYIDLASFILPAIT